MGQHKRGRYDPWTSAPDIAKWLADQLRKRDEAVAAITDDLTEPEDGPWHD